MPRTIQMLAAPTKARRIPDHATGHRAPIGLPQVQKRDRPMVQPQIIGKAQHNPIGPRRDLITTLCQPPDHAQFQRHATCRKQRSKVQPRCQIVHSLQPWVRRGEPIQPDNPLSRHPSRWLRHQFQPGEIRCHAGRGVFHPDPGFQLWQLHHPVLAAQIGPQRPPGPVARTVRRFAVGHRKAHAATRRNIRQRHFGIARNRAQQSPPADHDRGDEIGTAIDRGRNGAVRADLAMYLAPFDAHGIRQGHGLGSSLNSATKS